DENDHPTKNGAEQESNAIRKEPVKADGKTPAVVDIPDLPISTNLHWLWPCNGQTLDVPTTGVALEGTGDFQLAAKDNLEINLLITGGYCEPDAADRDLLFVVDVSSSMGGLLG